MFGLITDEKSFNSIAMSFYDNKECNSIDEFNDDLNKITIMKTHFVRFDNNGTTNFQLLFNHFISFVNCFGIASEAIIKYKLESKFHKKVNVMFIIIGQKQFDGTFDIDEDFFIQIQKEIKEKK